MRRYRVVFLDDQGRVADFQDLQFETDADAIDQVRARGHSSPVEVWSDGRMLGRVDPSPGSAGRTAAPEGENGHQHR